KPVVRLGNVSKPTLTLYRPAPGKDSGAVVMVCPGGGYSILAMDLEAVVIGRLSAWRIFSGPGDSASSLFLFWCCRHLSVTRPYHDCNLYRWYGTGLLVTWPAPPQLF